MGRQARKVGESHIYHVMIRGINRQTIFEDHDDESQFLSLLDEYALRCGFVLYGYCLMNNHVHLLIHEAKNPCLLFINNVKIEIGPGETLGQAMKRICVSYVLYFNSKYARTGHLFQDRFKSEPVDGSSSFLNVLRYIHLNPVKAGLCTHPEDYGASSYREYLGMASARHADISFALSIVTCEQLITCTNEANNDRFLDIKDKSHLKSDVEIKEILMEKFGIPSASAFQKLERVERTRIIRNLHNNGATMAQISRVTGCSKTIVYRVCCSGKKG